MYCSYFIGLSDTSKANEIEKRIAAVEPSKKTLLMKMGDAYKHERQIEKAKECYRKMLMNDPNNRTAQEKLNELE